MSSRTDSRRGCPFFYVFKEEYTIVNFLQNENSLSISEGFLTIRKNPERTNPLTYKHLYLNILFWHGFGIEYTIKITRYITT